MLRSARDAVAFLGETSFDDFMRNPILVAAIGRKVEIVGEAARSVSAQLRQAHPEIAWRKIVTARHILAHDYDDVDQEILYRIVRDHLPPLIERLRELLATAG